MTAAQKRQQVGSPDPELKTSPILEEEGLDDNVILPDADELPYCLFNSVSFDDGSYVCSGSGALLHCEQGVWVRQGGCDPDNP